MEQINYGVLEMMQAILQRQAMATPSTQGGERPDRDDFRKLLEARQSAEKDCGVKDPRPTAKDEEQTADTTQTVTGQGDSGLELQKQIACAALGLLQSPVVNMEQVAQNPQDAVPAVLGMAQAQSDMAVSTEQSTGLDMSAAPDADVTAMGQTTDQVLGQEQVPQEEIPQAVEKQAAVKHSADEPTALENERTAEQPEQQMELSMETPVFRDIQAVPIKVGEVPAAVQNGEVQAVKAQLSEHITTAISNGETKVDIQLEPEHLGRIQVEMTWAKDGALHITMYAESSHTQRMLERDITGLQALLSRSNQQEVSVDVGRQQESQRQDLYDGNNSGNQHGQPKENPHNRQRRDGQDFLQQLRLGLIPVDGEAS